MGLAAFIKKRPRYVTPKKFKLMSSWKEKEIYEAEKKSGR
jgi:hypothetical protein